MADIVPDTVGAHTGFDSEGWLLALALPAWIEFVRPRLTGHRNGWAVTMGVAVLLVISIWFYNSKNVIPTVKTLNETTLTVAVDDSSLVRFPTSLAEGALMLVLAPIAIDLTCRCTSPVDGASADDRQCQIDRR